MAPKIIIPTTEMGGGALTSTSTPQPDALGGRQVYEPFFIVTLSITRVYTTFTTTITLGGGSTIDPGLLAGSPVVTSIQPPPSTLTTITTITPLSSISTTAAANVSLVVPTASTDPSSTATIAAITGSVFGALGAIFLLWLCFFARRTSTLWFARPRRDSYSSGSSTADSASDYGMNIPPAPRPLRRPPRRGEDHGLGDHGAGGLAGTGAGLTGAAGGVAAAGGVGAALGLGRPQRLVVQERMSVRMSARPPRRMRPGPRDRDLDHVSLDG